MERISFSQVRARFSEILRRVAAGESFTITNRGEPVADVVPSRRIDRRQTQMTINDILASKKHAVSDLRLAIFRKDARK